MVGRDVWTVTAVAARFASYEQRPCTDGPMMDREMNSRGVRENNVISLRTFDIDRKSPICSDIPNVEFFFFGKRYILSIPYRG